MTRFGGGAWMRAVSEIAVLFGAPVFLFFYGMYQMRRIDRYLKTRKRNIRRAEEEAVCHIVSGPRKKGNGRGEACNEHTV